MWIERKSWMDVRRQNSKLNVNAKSPSSRNVTSIAEFQWRGRWLACLPSGKRKEVKIGRTISSVKCVRSFFRDAIDNTLKVAANFGDFSRFLVFITIAGPDESCKSGTDQDCDFYDFYCWFSSVNGDDSKKIKSAVVSPSWFIRNWNYSMKLNSNARLLSLRRLWRKNWILEQQTNLNFHLASPPLQYWRMHNLIIKEKCEDLGEPIQFIILLQPASSARHQTVLFVSFRDTIFSFVGRRLYFQFPASSIAREFKNLELPRKKNKAANNKQAETRDRSEKRKITFTSTRFPLWLRFL